MRTGVDREHGGSWMAFRRLGATLVLSAVLLPLLALPAYADNLSTFRADKAAETSLTDNASWNPSAADEAKLTAAEKKVAADVQKLTPAEKEQIVAEGSSISGKDASGNPTGITAMVINVIRFIFPIAAALAVLNVVWQGFKLMGSNPNSAAQAKSAILKSFLGLGTILLAWMIVGLVLKMVTGFA
jgi:hypothetical protein